MKNTYRIVERGSVSKASRSRFEAIGRCAHVIAGMEGKDEDHVMEVE
jgi:hypothetical protein